MQGLLQGTGVLLLVVGLVQGASRNTAPQRRRTRLAVAPSPRGAGAAVVGTF
jgi:hypothetical protein